MWIDAVDKGCPSCTMAADLTFTQKDRALLDAKGVTFVRPELVAEVRFSEWTSDGRLRHPSWRGLRPDKTMAEVKVEIP